mmetsp:Transcript_4382/g.13705  ORF Transcript_4382/g.13705 Transcript_4382/m.13705 type:complete len:227 (-) Transcript_4382:406-1086(-)
MKSVGGLVLVSVLSLGAALVPSSFHTAPSARAAFRSSRTSPVVVYSEDTSETALIKVTEETVQQAASISGATAGLVLGGPFFAIAGAIAGNYAAKQEGEVSEAVRGLGKAAIEFANFLVKLNSKYDLTSKASDAAGGAIAQLKEKDTDGTIAKVESVLSDATSKASDLEKEYSLIDKAKQALGYAGDLSTQAVDKAIELNAEYKISDKVTETAKSTVEKAIDATKK